MIMEESLDDGSEVNEEVLLEWWFAYQIELIREVLTEVKGSGALDCLGRKSKLDTTLFKGNC